MKNINKVVRTLEDRLAKRKFHRIIKTYDNRDYYNHPSNNILLIKRFFNVLEIFFPILTRKILNIKKKEIPENYIELIKYNYLTKKNPNEYINRLLYLKKYGGWEHPYDHHGSIFKKNRKGTCLYHSIRIMELFKNLKILNKKKINQYSKEIFNNHNKINYYSYYKFSNDCTLNIQAETICYFMKIKFKYKFNKTLLEKWILNKDLFWNYYGEEKFGENFIDSHHNAMIISSLFKVRSNLKNKLLFKYYKFYKKNFIKNNEVLLFLNQKRKTHLLSGYLETMKLAICFNDISLVDKLCGSLIRKWNILNKNTNEKRFFSTISYGSIRFGDVALYNILKPIVK